MDAKRGLLTSLREVFDSWDKLLAGESEEGINAQRYSAGWSIKDVIAHLRAWQQISVARLEAALYNAEPDYPPWLAGADPFFAEEHTDEFNLRIFAIYHDQSWSSVHLGWKQGFLRLLKVAEAIPKKDILDPQRYPWLKGDTLGSVLQGSCEHHQEHLAAIIEEDS